MYERFYNLRERPFSLSPDPDYLYLSRVHREALSFLRYGIETQAGFVVVTGEIGSGKTTLLQTVLRGLDRQTSVARLVNTMLDPRELLEAVMLDFGLEPAPGHSKPLLLRDLARYLVEQRSAGRLALLVVDEAQNLSLSALEEVRMLSNLETEKSKLIQMVLVGQPNLRDVLARPELEQLRQRVTVSYHLQALDAGETAAYINHRLKRAAIGAPLEFQRPVTDLIHQHSGGVPRKINVISDAVLLFGYGEEQKVVTADLVREAIEDLVGTGVLSSAPAGATTLDPPAAGSTPAAVPTPAQADRERELARRERQVAERERQLAEQQRVLNEQAQLLRAYRDSATQKSAWSARFAGASDETPAASAAARSSAAVGRSPSSPAPPQKRPAVQPTRIVYEPPRPAAQARVAAQSPPLWTRIRKQLFGKFALED